MTILNINLSNGYDMNTTIVENKLNDSIGKIENLTVYVYFVIF